MKDRCAAGYPITSEPCTRCGATMDDACRLLTCEQLERFEERKAERAHFSIIEDGPDRFVLLDDRSEEPAPVFHSVDATVDYLEYLLK